MENNNIAIVGIDCRYPGSHSPEQFWENILALRQQFRKIPDKRLNLAYYGSEDKTQLDTTYCKKAAVLLGYHFDRIQYRISKATFDRTDMAHWLALDVATGALKDAGFEAGDGLLKEKVGVIIGNSLNGEFTRANLMRIRWPYVFKTIESTLNSLDYAKEEIGEILTRAEKIYKDPFPTPNADTLAGGLSNTIAGRICNYYDFNGGGYTIDGACSSSLLALMNGYNSILSGHLDVALVGGVDLSIDPFELIGFSRNGALAKTNMEVFGNKPQGFWPGEGCGMVVLMKEAAAKEKGLNIYAIIKGCGISSDGKGGVTRPKPETQQLAMKRAYERAGYPINSVSLFEAHGTGTPIGDKIELSGLVDELAVQKKKGTPAAIVGSVKNIIGHTKAAAGIAGVIKACLALKNRIIPATIHNSGINPVLAENNALLAMAKQPLLYQQKAPMRASISSFGFGGINVHITIEENSNRAFQPNRIPTKTKKLSDSPRDAEVFPLVANSKNALLKKLAKLTKIARDISYAELIDLSAALIGELKKTAKWKVSLVASTTDQLLENLVDLSANIEAGKTTYYDLKKGIFFNATGKKAAIAFLFPGQGAPIYPDLGFADKLNKELLNIEDQEVLEPTELKHPVTDTSLVQPLIVQRNLLGVSLLNNLGVEAEWGIGNSLGEITACAWASCIGKKEVLEIAKQRGRVMAAFGEPQGTLLALRSDLNTVERLIEPFEVCITGYNATQSFVVGGHIAEIERLEHAAFEAEIQCTRLKVSHAFHTPMMKKAAVAFKDVLAEIEFKQPNKKVISTVDNKLIGAKTDLREQLYQQIEQPVKFIQAVSELKEKVAFFIETGPGKSLTKSLAKEDLNVLSIDFGASSTKGLLLALSACFVVGKNVEFEELFFNRFYNKFDLDNWVLDVLENPCEKLDQETSLDNILNKTTENVAPIVQAKIEQVDATETGILKYIKELISRRTEIPVENIHDAHRIMSQLHLNSLTITEMVSLVAKTFNKSHKVFSKASILANADGSLQDLTTLIFNGENGQGKATEGKEIDFEVLPNWTYLFKRTAIAKNISTVGFSKKQGSINVLGPDKEVAPIKQRLAEQPISLGNGTIFVYHMANAKALHLDFLSLLKQASVQQGDFFCLVNLSSPQARGDLKPMLRSFQLEYPEVQTLCLDFDAETEQKAEKILEELKVCTKYKEVVYEQKQRKESAFFPFFPRPNDISKQLPPESLILATGGGKGITFESLRQLARSTKAKIALLGRSSPEQDPILAKNLKTLDEEGITYRYFAADVCDKEKVEKAVNCILAELGQINVVLHGAGINIPKKIAALQPQDFHKTTSVKVQGLANVLAALKTPPQLLIGYGSVIAQSGMKGNTDYAWANDQMAVLLDNYAHQNPNCRCICLEWSVWEGTGMGQKLNSIEGLKLQGIWPIPIKKGVEILKAVIADSNCAGRLVAAGRFGKIPTFSYHKQRRPIGRFIRKVKQLVPQIEAVCEVNINLNEDQYLKHHVFEGRHVFPTVMILEGMAQVCSILTPNRTHWLFKEMQINKSIFIPKDKANTLRFSVTRIDEDRYKAEVRSEDSDFEICCFEAIIDFNLHESIPTIANIEKDKEALQINVGEDFYDNLLFHSGPFRRIKSFYKIHALASLALAATNMEDQWFDSFISEHKLLGDPGLNDAAIHCHQASRPAQQLLPTAASEIYFNPSLVEGPFFIKTLELTEDGKDTTIDVWVINEKGQVRTAWKNLVLTQVSNNIRKRVWVPELLVPYIEYQLMRYTDNRGLKLSLKDCQQMVAELQNNNNSKACSIASFSVSLQKQKALNGNSNLAGNKTKNPFTLKGQTEEVVLQIHSQSA